MAYWLVEANDRSGALWGFLVEAERLSKPQVVDRLRAAGKAVEISGQIVDVRDLDFASLQVRHDPASMQTGGRTLPLRRRRSRTGGRDWKPEVGVKARPGHDVRGA